MKDPFMINGDKLQLGLTFDTVPVCSLQSWWIIDFRMYGEIHLQLKILKMVQFFRYIDST